MRYLNRQYWEKVKDGSQAEPSAPTVQYDDDASSANVYEGDADESTVGYFQMIVHHKLIFYLPCMHSLIF